MAKRTQIVCLHEGEKGRSIDPVFINRLLKSLKPAWIRPWGSNVVRLIPCDGRSQLIKRMPDELKLCLKAGGHVTLMVWADQDDDVDDAEALKTKFWIEAQKQGITRDQFDQVVFAFPRDRLENWIQFLLEGQTNEEEEGPRIKNNKLVADAAKILAKRCATQQAEPPLPPSLVWSCENWKTLVARIGNG